MGGSSACCRLFRVEETRQLLEASGIALPDADIASLLERTEGWAAGLRLAVLSLAGGPDPERLLAGFSGSERTVAGYLLAEVLERQRAEVRDLLLRTSMLKRVSCPLADSLTDLPGLWREVPPSSAVIVQPGDDQEVPFTPRAPD